MSFESFSHNFHPLEAQHKEALRNLLAEALKHARAFDGTEDSYEALVRSLITLENASASAASVYLDVLTLPGQALATDQEQKLLQMYHPTGDETKRRINALLEMASDSLAKRLERDALQPEPEDEDTPETPIPSTHLIRLHGIILPPDEGSILPRAKEQPSPVKPPRFQERLNQLLALLRSQKIFLNDLILYVGDPPTGRMRKVSYSIVTIPHMETSILVCDQVNEGTFVIQGGCVNLKGTLVSRKRYLKIEYSGRLTFVKYSTQEQWEARLREVLFAGELPSPNRDAVKKIYVAERAKARENRWPPFDEFVAQVRDWVAQEEPEPTGEKYQAVARFRGWPSSPNMTYKDKGWVSWIHLFTGKKEKQRTPDDFPSFDQFVTQVRDWVAREEPEPTGDKYQAIAISRGWPFNPDISYRNKGWISWIHLFTGREEKMKRTKDFPLFDEFVAQVRDWVAEQSDRSGLWPRYRAVARSRGWPLNVKKIYENKGWVSLSHLFTGKDKRIRKFDNFLSFDDFAIQVREWISKGGLRSEYRVVAKTKGWPVVPSEIYKDQGWVSWTHLFTGKEKEDFPPFDQFVRQVRDWGAQEEPKPSGKRYRAIAKAKGWPLHPDVTYKNNGWISWIHLFTGREEKK